MIFSKTKLKDAYFIDIEKREDPRGFFARAWCQKEFEEHGITTSWVQANLALSNKKGTLRGLHYQVAPYEEAKLMRCIQGAIYDVIIDLRPESSTYKQWLGAELTADNHRMLYIPKGFAHGYQALMDNTKTFYQVSEFYASGAEQGIRWDDPAFDIQWPETKQLIISDKDKAWPDFTL